MRVLTYVLCSLCLAGGAVTSFAMTRLSLADEVESDGPVPRREPSIVEIPSDQLPVRSVNRSPDSVESRVHLQDGRFLEENERLKRRAELDRMIAEQGPGHPSVLYLQDELANVVFPDSSSDNRSSSTATIESQPAVATMRKRLVRRTVVGATLEPIPAEELAAAKKLQEAIKSLNDSSEPEAQKKATETIQQQLSEQFDLDLKQREKELAEVEAKVKSLREKLDKRKAAREDIISLRLKTITNDAAGLGFPGGGGANQTVESEFPMLPAVNAGAYSDDVRVYSTSPQPIYPAFRTNSASANSPPLTLPPATPKLPPGDAIN